MKNLNFIDVLNGILMSKLVAEAIFKILGF